MAYLGMILIIIKYWWNELTVNPNSSISFTSGILSHAFVLSQVLIGDVEYSEFHVNLERGRAGDVLRFILLTVVQHLRVTTRPVVEWSWMRLREALQRDVVAARHAYQLVWNQQLWRNCKYRNVIFVLVVGEGWS